MAECDPSSSSLEYVGLSTDDITPKVYEGGFKTWECAVDLATFLASRDEILSRLLEQSCHVIELGAGAAIPTLFCFRHSLLHSPTTPTLLTLADYNDSVLQLATLPNLLLLWHFTVNSSCPGPGDLDITPGLLSQFTRDLSERNIRLNFVSGSWGSDFVELTSPVSFGHTPKVTLVLASETIYSPLTIPIFTSTLLSLLASAQSRAGEAQALLAAKKIYFGIGGGVDEFVGSLSERGGSNEKVWETSGGGVGRVVLRVWKERIKTL